MMRLWEILLAVAIVVPAAHADCGSAALVRDRGLHRAWRIEQDCAHRERPAVLVEVPWTSSGGVQEEATGSRAPREPLVRAGSPVTVAWRSENSWGSLAATALTTGGLGERVRVRSRFGGAIFVGQVRGPGWVERVRGRVEP
jgi:hypothetical protein